MFMLQDDSGIEPILHEWVPWTELGTAPTLAVIGAEDQRFADHNGLDLKAIKKAFDEQNERGYLRGASTITQQTVKNLYLWPGRSFLRKGLEAWLALVAELCLPKRRILEIYLNIAEFGPGIYGIGAASNFFFGRHPKSLSDHQAASLASVLPQPEAIPGQPPLRQPPRQAGLDPETGPAPETRGLADQNRLADPRHSGLTDPPNPGLIPALAAVRPRPASDNGRPLTCNKRSPRPSGRSQASKNGTTP